MALIRTELDITPDPEIRRLVDQARARPAARDEPAPPPAGDASPGSPAPESLPPTLPPPGAPASAARAQRAPWWLVVGVSLALLFLGYAAFRLGR